MKLLSYRQKAKSDKKLPSKLHPQHDDDKGGREDKKQTIASNTKKSLSSKKEKRFIYATFELFSPKRNEGKRKLNKLK